MDDRKRKLAFWLMPAGEAKSFFASLVDDLARRLDAPAFEPHVTLQGGEIEEQRAVRLLENVATSSAPLPLQISGIEFSEKYTKTLYVQFRPSADASAMSNSIAEALGSDSGYKFDPHLSLLYKAMPEAQKEEIAREITIPFQQVRFDAVALVSVPASIEGPEDVHAWRTIAERPLAGGAR
jgi:2'-5' RNA ligase